MPKQERWNSLTATYTFIKEIGKGGNGRVYLVKAGDGTQYALKVLLRTGNKKAYSRFKDEIDILYQLKHKRGVIPLVDAYLPATSGQHDVPFYVMPVGIPLTEYLKDKPHNQIYDMFLILTDSLRELHDRDITHRDIKPANMLIVNGWPVLSDFGLANFPKKKRISSVNESIGARWTIAPEMQRISTKAEYKKADIYSLAKSLWMLVTGQHTGFEGQYIPESPISIKRYIDLKINTMIIGGVWYYHSVVLLEKLLIQATSNDPEERPDCTGFLQQLLYWLNTNDKHGERNPYEWQNALERIFPIAVPPHCEWTGTENILKILGMLIQYDSLAYVSLPDFGGEHFQSLTAGPEKETILLNDQIVIQPVRLIFELIEEELAWSYFRLESAIIKPETEIKERERMESVYYGEEGWTSEKCSDTMLYDRVVSGCLIFTYNTSFVNYVDGELNGHGGYHSQVDAGAYREELRKYREGKYEALAKLAAEKKGKETAL